MWEKISADTSHSKLSLHQWAEAVLWFTSGRCFCFQTKRSPCSDAENAHPAKPATVCLSIVCHRHHLLLHPSAPSTNRGFVSLQGFSSSTPCNASSGIYNLYKEWNSSDSREWKTKAVLPSDPGHTARVLSGRRKPQTRAKGPTKSRQR